MSIALQDHLVATEAPRDFRSAGEEHRILLGDVSWETYAALRAGDRNGGVRMTFDGGSLEIVSPSYRPESSSNVLGRFVEAFTEEGDLPLRAAGSTTWQLPSHGKGLEADRCYYIQNAAAVAGCEEIDLTIHPPPDLAAEVEVSSPALAKLPIYEAMKVPEVWLWRRGRIRVFVFGTNGTYAESDESRCLPGFPFRDAERLIDQRSSADDNTLVRAFRKIVRDLLPKASEPGDTP